MILTVKKPLYGLAENEQVVWVVRKRLKNKSKYTPFELVDAFDNYEEAETLANMANANDGDIYDYKIVAI